MPVTKNDFQETGLPKPADLYMNESGRTDQSPLSPPSHGATWEEPLKAPERKKHWYDHFVDTTAHKVITGTVLASMIVGGTAPVWAPAIASQFEGRTTIPNTYNPPALTQPIDQNALYRSNAQAAILQSVPELANYKSALDYTTQRLTDMKNVYNIQLDQAIVPVSKWVKANIDWDKKGERLIPLNEKINFMPDTLFNENGTFDESALDQNYQAVQKDRLESNLQRPLSSETVVSLFALNTESIANGHNQIWTDIRDPAKMEEYLISANLITYVPYENQYMAKHKKAIIEHGTFEDRAHFALIGRAWITPIKDSNEELKRNEVSYTMILAVGGDARIERNEQVWDISSYKDTAKLNSRPGDRQLAFRKSAQLKDYFASNKQTYGTPLDLDYIEPALPSIEVVNALKGYISPESGTKFLGITSVSYFAGVGKTNYLFGGP